MMDKRTKKTLTIGVITLVLGATIAGVILTKAVRREEGLLDAVHRGSFAHVRKLVEDGADVNVRHSEDGRTALHCLVERTLVRPGQRGVPRQELLRIAEYLIDNGAEIDAKYGGGRTPLDMAVFVGNFELVRLFVTKGADVNVQDATGDTPLLFAVGRAVSAGDTRYVLFLLENGAKVDVKNKSGETPVDFLLSSLEGTWGPPLNPAERTRAEEMIQLLRKYSEPMP